MARSFFSRQVRFPLTQMRVSVGLLVLMSTFAALPMVLRSARLAVEHMKNDVKDWLPEGFAETAELAWFREQFLGEQFVLVSWPGCTAEDESLELLKRKLTPPDPSARHGDAVASPDDPDSLKPREFVGDALGLYVATEQREGKTVVQDYRNWAGQDERWLRGAGRRWYYITPDGRLFRWDGETSLFAAAWHTIERTIRGRNVAEGEHLATLPERYYEDIRLLEAQLFETVTTGPDVMERLAGESGVLLRGNADEDAQEEARRMALARLQGLLFGPNGKQTCLLVTLTPVARENLHLAVGRGWFGKPRGRIRIYAEESGVRPDELRLGGPPVDNVAVDEEGTRTQVRLIGYSAAVGLGLAFLCFRSVKITTLVFFIGGAAGVGSMALVWWGGTTMDAVLMTMPALVYVLGMSGAVHMVNYYRDAVREHGLDGAPERALRHGWRPCTLAAFTTALGLLSLCTSEIVPISKFGVFSALGVMATLLFLFLIVPAWLQVWPPGFRREGSDAPPPLESPAVEAIRRFWDRACDSIVNHHLATAAVCTAAMIVFALGLLRIDTSVQMLKLFSDDARIVQDYAWLEENLGPLVPLEMVLRVDRSRVLPSSDERDGDAPTVRYPLGLLERVEMVRQVERAIVETFGPEGTGEVGGVMTAATFAPELPEAGGGLQSFARRRAYQAALERHKQEMIEADYLRIDRQDQAELWRVSLRLRAFGDIDFGQFIGELKQAVEPVLAAYRHREQILRRLDEQSPDGSFAGGRVLILLGPRSAEVRAEPTPTTGAVDQARLFASTLHDLLENARLRPHVAAFKFDEKSETGFPGSEVASLAEDFDAVVLVEDHPALDLELLENHARLAIDARDHRYLHGEEASRTAAWRFQEQQDPDTGIFAVYTGVVPVVYKAQRTLLNSLIESIGWAFVMIAVVMMVLLRSARAGMVSMLPNVFPVVIIFGAMGLMGVSIDIGSMMTASVAMGVAVDDTIHFLTWFRAGLDRGLDRPGAIRLAYRRCAVAMTQTTAIGGLGLAVFAASSFTPTQRFGALMLGLLAAALVGDLIFLPALLASPLGAVFRSSKKQPTPAVDAVRTESIPAPHMPHSASSAPSSPIRRRGA